jgi:hypothetical protein
MGALGDFSAMTLADVALPSAVGKLRRHNGIRALSPRLPKKLPAGLVPGMSSVTEAGVGAGLPTATGSLAPTEALAGTVAPSTSLQGPRHRWLV